MVRCYLSGNIAHDKSIIAFYEGCAAEKKLVSGWQYEPSDIAVIFGVYKSKVPLSFPRGEIMAQQKNAVLDTIVLETGYINRGDDETHHYAAGFNGLNGRADFVNEDSPADRVLVNLEPWRNSGNHVLVCGQVPWDASVDHIDFMKWLEDAIAEVRIATDRPIRLRHHPVINKPRRTLEEDLQDCWAVVTFNSNVGVDAAIAGVPVFAADKGSMAWPIANKDILKINNPQRPERQQWLNNLCYAQWTQAEMREGATWKHLSRHRVSRETRQSTSLNASTQAG